MDPLKKLGAQPSKSEEKGISLLTEKDLVIFSPGTSTGGFAEVKMALLNPQRKITTTTIDKEGLKKTNKLIKELHLENRIHAKFEDVTELLPYTDNQFDFIYTRLLLHYLSKQDLNKTLREFHRVLKPSGKVFIVIRAVGDWEEQLDGTTFDEETQFTTYPILDENMKKTGNTSTRYFHSVDSITKHLKKAGFNVTSIKQYNEQLYQDYMRTKPVAKKAKVIEVIAEKQSRILLIQTLPTE